MIERVRKQMKLFKYVNLFILLSKLKIQASAKISSNPNAQCCIEKAVQTIRILSASVSQNLTSNRTTNNDFK